MQKFVEKLEDAFVGKRITVARDRVEMPSGHQFVKEIVKVTDAVGILGETVEGKLVLLKNYRYPVQKWLYEVPAGKIDPGETPMQAAERELKEETGYTAEEIIQVGAFYSSPGICTEKLYLFAATGLVAGEQALEPSEEGLKVELFTPEEAQGLLFSGEIQDQKTALLIAGYFI
jgi:ADP-ribose pyrophosphatase